MTVVKGVLQSVNSKPSLKNPELFKVGLMLNGIWHNTCTKFPQKYQKGQQVEITLPDDPSALVPFSNIKVLSPSDAPVQSNPTPQSNSKGDEILKSITLLNQAIQALTSKMTKIEGKLDALTINLIDEDIPDNKSSTKPLAGALEEMNEAPFDMDDPEF